MTPDLSTISDLENSSEFLCGFTDTKMRLLYTNRSFQEQFGLKNKNWKGQPFMEVVRTFQMERLMQANADCISHPDKSVSIEIQTVAEEKENWFRWEISALLDKEKKVNGVRFLGTDITRQKKTEQALLQQAILLDNISDVIVSADESLSIKSWNLQAEMIFNLRHENGSDRCVHEISSIDFVNDDAGNFRKSTAENGSWSGEVLIVKKDGTKFNMLAMVNAIKDKAGRRTGFVAVCRDITREREMKNRLDSEKQQSRQGLAKEKQQFRSFMENAPLLAWIIDKNGVLKYMNSRFKDAFGYTDDQINNRIGGGGKINDREKLLLPHRDVIEKNKCIEFLQEWMDENHEMHYYRTFKFPIQDVSGNWLEGGQSIDITSELLTQRELKRGNELFEYASRATRDVIWDWDLKSDKIRRTDGYKTLFGYETEELYEPNSFERIHPDDRDNMISTIENALGGNESRWYIEYRYCCADGSYKNVIDQAYIVRNKSGKPVRAIGSMQDVTAERNLQKQVLMAEMQKKKDVVNAVIDAQEKERRELSAELHDNVNQMLAATILYLRSAQKDAISGKTLVERGIDYLQKAVEELRNISRNLTPGELKLNGLLPALKVFAERLQIPNSFEVQLILEKIQEEDISPALKLSVYRMVQEMTNNIIKHAQATKVKISLGKEGNTLKLTVTDNGKGFDPVTVKRGLGITNIQTRAENFNGIVNIISSPGAGSTFAVSIPLT
ncbi:MAG TPA: PAS domain S-box protein [Chitinophagaceae bacterium]|nr:PAS domain S-box protein [Chitinophagaceae bacterium]